MALNQIVTFLLIGIGLSFDTFAISVSSGIMKKGILFRQAVVVALFLAFFQALFPVIGWFIGVSVKSIIAGLDHWVAFGLLLLIGGKMILEGLKNEDDRKVFNPLNPAVMIGISVATSIDALVVGLSFGVLDTHILFPALIIGVVTFLAAMLGIFFGKHIPGKTSQRSMIAGGLILVLIGGKILLEHLSA